MSACNMAARQGRATPPVIDTSGESCCDVGNGKVVRCSCDAASKSQCPLHSGDAKLTTSSCAPTATDCCPLTTKKAHTPTVHYQDSPLHVLRNRSAKRPARILRELSMDPDVKAGTCGPGLSSPSTNRTFNLRPSSAQDWKMCMSMSVTDLTQYITEELESPNQRPEQAVKNRKHLKRAFSWSMGMQAKQFPTRTQESSKDLCPPTPKKPVKHVRFTDEHEELCFQHADGLAQSISFSLFNLFNLDDGLLSQLRNSIPENLSHLIPLKEKPHQVSTVPGKLADYSLPEYDEETEKELAEQLRFAKKRQNDYQVDLILNDDDDTTNGWFASHIGIHGADPEEWMVYNPALAMETIPEIYHDILERDRLRLLASALKKWLCSIRGPPDTAQRASCRGFSGADVRAATAGGECFAAELRRPKSVRSETETLEEGEEEELQVEEELPEGGGAEGHTLAAEA